MSHIIPKKWETFQHYKDRSPPWIKLHKVILDDYDFHRLPLASKALAPCLWLLASEYEDGRIPLDYECIAFRVRWAVSEVIDAIKHLIDKKFFIHETCASNELALCEQDAMPETEAYKEEVETYTPETENKKHSRKNALDYDSYPEFIEFWNAYPSKIGKDAALKKWIEKNPPIDTVLNALAWQVNCEKWRNGFIPNPATYLNQGRWQDEPPKEVTF